MSPRCRTGALAAILAALLATGAGCTKSNGGAAEAGPPEAGPDKQANEAQKPEPAENPPEAAEPPVEVVEPPLEHPGHDGVGGEPPIEAAEPAGVEPPAAETEEPPPEVVEPPVEMVEDKCAGKANPCTPASATRCSADDGAIETCAADGDGCLVWGVTTTCTPGKCSNGTCTECAAPPPACAGVTTFPSTVCADSKDVVTCDKDADGCVVAGAPVACSENKTCAGAPGAASCQCGGGGVTLCDGNQAPVYCLDGKTKAICAKAADGCYVVTDEVACADAETCQGPDASAYCACPLRPDQAGYDSADDGKAGTGCLASEEASFDPKVSTRCDSTTGAITKCQTVGTGAGACLVWVAQPACTGGLSCTTDGKDADGKPVSSPHCGCADVTDGVFYVDPAAGHDEQWTLGGVSVRPTGSNDAALCRFKTLYRALAAATGDGGSSGPGANQWAGHLSKLSHQLASDGEPAGTSGRSVTPILVTTEVKHGLSTGMQAAVSGVLGDTAANGTFEVNAGADCTSGSAGPGGPCSDYEVELKGTIGNGDYAVITAESDTAPIKLTTDADHNLATGDTVTIACSNGAGSIPAARGTWTVTRVDGKSFTLDGSAGNGTACSQISTVPVVVPAGAHARAKVVATGAVPVIFGAEPATLPVNDRVSVAGGDGTTPADYVLQGSVAGGDFVVLAGAGSFEGFTVANNVPAGMARPRRALSCTDAGTGARAFRHLVLDGKGPRTGSQFTRQDTGLYLGNDCVATADDVVIGGPDVVGDPAAQDDELGYLSHGVHLDSGDLASAGGLVVRNTLQNGVDLDFDTGAKVGRFVAAGAILSHNGSGLFKDEDGIGDFTGKYANLAGQWDGASATGPVVTLHGGSVDGAGGDGLSIGSGVLTLDQGVVVRGNGIGEGRCGIDAWDAGTPDTVPSLATDATVDVDSNAIGVCVQSWMVAMTGTRVHGSQEGEGVNVSNAGHTPAFTVTLTGVEIDHNDTDGLVVDRADRTQPDLAKLVTIDTANVHDNGIVATNGGGNGIDVNPSNKNEASVLIVRSTVAANGLSGVKFGQKAAGGGYTHEAIQDCDVNGNHTLKVLGAMDPDTDGAGLLFASSSTLTGATGNKIHENLGPEVRFMEEAATLCGLFGNAACPDTAPPGFPGTPAYVGAWDLTPLTDGCDDTANQVYCYNEASDIGVATATGVHVIAKWVHWRNTSPAAGREYSISGNVDATSPCAPVTTCP